MLLIDGTDRVLLFRSYVQPDEPDLGDFWLTPGGGVNDGETLNEAAARELHEETGLVVLPEALGPVVAETSGHADFDWATGIFQDSFFLHRVDRHDVDTSGFEALERSQIVAHRWWPLTDVATTTETIYPLGLASLLRDLVAGRVPAEPVQLPWHH